MDSIIVLPKRKRSNRFFTRFDNNHRLIFNNTGFTLVELVIVVVILVIISTIAIPAMTSYFNKKRSEKIKEQVENIFEVSKVKFLGLYAEYTHNGNYTCVLQGKKNNKGEYKDTDQYNSVNTDNGFCMECDMHLNPLSSEILSLSGMNINNDEPCSVIVGLGRYDIYADPFNDDYDLEKAYTVYMIIYQPVFQKDVYYYYNEEIYKYFPFDGNKDDRNNLIVDGVKIQLYHIKNGKDNNNRAATMWGEIKKYSKNKPNS